MLERRPSVPAISDDWRRSVSRNRWRQRRDLQNQALPVKSQKPRGPWPRGSGSDVLAPYRRLHSSSDERPSGHRRIEQRASQYSELECPQSTADVLRLTPVSELGIAY